MIWIFWEKITDLPILCVIDLPTDCSRMPRDSGSQERKEEISPLSLIGLPPAAAACAGLQGNGPLPPYLLINAVIDPSPARRKCQQNIKEPIK